MNRLEDITLRQKLDFKFEGRVIQLFDSKNNPIEEETFSENPDPIYNPFIVIQTKSVGPRKIKFHGSIPSYTIGHKMQYFKSGYEMWDEVKQELVDLSTCPKHKVYSGYYKNPSWNNNKLIRLANKLQAFEEYSISFFKNAGMWLYKPLRSILHL